MWAFSEFSPENLLELPSIFVGFAVCEDLERRHIGQNANLCAQQSSKEVEIYLPREMSWFLPKETTVSKALKQDFSPFNKKRVV